MKWAIKVHGSKANVKINDITNIKKAVAGLWLNCCLFSSLELFSHFYTELKLQKVVDM